MQCACKGSNIVLSPRAVISLVRWYGLSGHVIAFIRLHQSSTLLDLPVLSLTAEDPRNLLDSLRDGAASCHRKHPPQQVSALLDEASSLPHDVFNHNSSAARLTAYTDMVHLDGAPRLSGRSHALVNSVLSSKEAFLRHPVFHVLKSMLLNLRSVKTTTTKPIMLDNSLTLLPTVKNELGRKMHVEATCRHANTRRMLLPCRSRSRSPRISKSTSWGESLEALCRASVNWLPFRKHAAP